MCPIKGRKFTLLVAEGQALIIFKVELAVRENILQSSITPHSTNI